MDHPHRQRIRSQAAARRMATGVGRGARLSRRAINTVAGAASDALAPDAPESRIELGRAVPAAPPSRRRPSFKMFVTGSASPRDRQDWRSPPALPSRSGSAVRLPRSAFRRCTTSAMALPGRGSPGRCQYRFWPLLLRTGFSAACRTQSRARPSDGRRGARFRHELRRDRLCW